MVVYANGDITVRKGMSGLMHLYFKEDYIAPFTTKELAKSYARAEFLDVGVVV